MTTYQCFTAVLFLIYGSLFLNGIYYCLRVFWCATARMSDLELEQRTNIKFLVKLGKSGNEIREMLVQVYRDYAMKKTEVYKWLKSFSEGRESVTDEERSGQPATSRTEENIAKVPQNQFQTCFEGWTGRWHPCIVPMGSTLKATMVVFSSEVCTSTAMSSRTLLSDHVCTPDCVFFHESILPS